MKKHFMIEAGSTGRPACDTVYSLVTEGVMGTKDRLEVSCLACRNTLAWKNHGKVIHFAIDGHSFCHTACGLELKGDVEFITPKADKGSKYNCKNCKVVLEGRTQK
jgi:hypothetical protein